MEQHYSGSALDGMREEIEALRQGDIPTVPEVSMLTGIDEEIARLRRETPASVGSSALDGIEHEIVRARLGANIGRSPLMTEKK